MAIHICAVVGNIEAAVGNWRKNFVILLVFAPTSVTFAQLTTKRSHMPTSFLSLVSPLSPHFPFPPFFVFLFFFKKKVSSV